MAGSLPSDSKIRFHYIKSNYFRVIHVDGALGGVTPSGFIHCAVYSERAAIPQVTEHAIVEDGLSEEATLIEGRAGVVREVDVDLMMSRSVAEKLRDWLTKRIGEYDALTTGSSKPK
jgi:hypothetical protein